MRIDCVKDVKMTFKAYFNVIDKDNECTTIGYCLINNADELIAFEKNIYSLKYTVVMSPRYSENDASLRTLRRIDIYREHIK